MTDKTPRPGHFHGRRSMRATLILPIPPSANDLWTVSRGRVHRSARYEAWRREAGWRLREQRPPEVPGCVAVRIRVGIVDKARDLDNLVKATLDLLAEHRVIENDVQVAAIEVRWDRTVPAGRVEVEVRTSLPPAYRTTAATREKIAAANAARGARARLAAKATTTA